MAVYESIFSNAPIAPGASNGWKGTFQGHHIIPSEIAERFELMRAGNGN
jgi:hypothetical protein